MSVPSAPHLKRDERARTVVRRGARTGARTVVRRGAQWAAWSEVQRGPTLACRGMRARTAMHVPAPLDARAPRAHTARPAPARACL